MYAEGDQREWNLPDKFRGVCVGLWCGALAPLAGVRSRARLRKGSLDEHGQGTTEYAILVGVLVVMAIIAIALFRPRLQELWNSIAEGINSL